MMGAMTLAPREHALFRQYPPGAPAMLSTGPAPTPYRVYDGTALFVGGRADLAAARELLAGEQVVPVPTEDGHALMAAWVCEFRDASLGPHHELQLSLFVSSRELAPVSAHPLALIELMVTRPEIGMLCHGLWNDTRQVVAYNRELLGLDARLSSSRIGRQGGRLAFSVQDAADGTPLVEGELHRVGRPSLGAGLALVGRLGVHRLATLAREPWIRMPVLSPTAGSLGRNAVAESFTRTDRSVLRRFDGRRDRLEIQAPRYRALRFEPQFFQCMEGFKFVYLAPR